MNSSADTLMRPDDENALRQTLRQLRERSGIPVLFAGQVHGGVLGLSQFVGLRTRGLRGLSVHPATGLGGRVLATGRTAGVTDYGSASSITHDYDGPVLAEGIRSVVAVPVLVGAGIRAVLYGASRGPAPLGGRSVDAVALAARGLAAEIAVRDEVDLRLRLRGAADGDRVGRGVDIEALREIHAELLIIAQQLPDPGLRTRLLDAAGRLTGSATASPAGAVPRLAPRERDVLAQVALGCSNAEAARRLALLPETVKAYLRSSMRKLGARTRFEAVLAARRHGLLP